MFYNSKVKTFWKIIKNKLFYPNSFDSLKDLIYNLGNFLFEYNHLRRHRRFEYITPYEKLEKVTELLS
jgi:transposase InsO family protein